MRKGQDVADTVDGRGVGPVVSSKTHSGGGGKRETGNAIGKRWSREQQEGYIHSVRLLGAQQEERRRKGEEEEDEMPGAGGEKNVCSRRPDGAVIDSMKKTLYSFGLTHITH